MSCVNLPAPARLPRRSLAGLTLVELAVTLSIASILVAVAAPYMSQLMTGRAADSQAEEMVTALRLARSEALKRGGEVSLCASTTTNLASPTCSKATDWVSGWVTFYEYGAANGDLTGNEAKLHVYAPAKGVKTVTGSASFVTFSRNGQLIGGGGAASFKFVPYKDNAAKGYTRTVCVNQQGRVSLNKGDIACP
jgi:type IV fimbrial biogenesis protein FimT